MVMVFDALVQTKLIRAIFDASDDTLLQHCTRTNNEVYNSEYKVLEPFKSPHWVKDATIHCTRYYWYGSCPNRKSG